MWYTVDVLYRGIHDEKPREDDLWQECILLIDANEREEAEARAEQLAMTNECQYQAADATNLKWVFDSILSVTELFDEKITDGTELFSRFLCKQEILSLKRSIKR